MREIRIGKRTYKVGIKATAKEISLILFGVGLGALIAFGAMAVTAPPPVVLISYGEAVATLETPEGMETDKQYYDTVDNVRP